MCSRCRIHHVQRALPLMIQERGPGKGREQEGGLLLEAEKTMRTQHPLRPTCEVMVRYDKVRERAQCDKKQLL